VSRRKISEIQRLYDILEYIQKVETHLAGKGFTDFMNNDMLNDAVLRCMEILGEATIHIPQSTKSLYPNIKWSALEKMRNILAHGYRSINPLMVWNVYRQDFRTLKSEVGDILARRLSEEEAKKQAQRKKE
jgi:uncharacterized protein with HEPN domain